MPELYSTNSVGLNFREVVEKIKKAAKKRKIGNLQNGQEKYGGNMGQNFKNTIISSNFSLKLL